MAVVPVYNSILVPESTFVLQTDYYKKMTGKVPNQGAARTCLVRSLLRTVFIRSVCRVQSPKLIRTDTL